MKTTGETFGQMKDLSLEVMKSPASENYRGHSGQTLPLYITEIMLSAFTFNS